MRNKFLLDNFIPTLCWLAVVVVFSLCVALGASCAWDAERIAALDNGSMIRSGRGASDVVLWSDCPLPYTVGSGIDARYANTAAESWGAALGYKILHHHDGSTDVPFVIHIDMGYIPEYNWSDEPDPWVGWGNAYTLYGISNVQYDLRNGKIQACDITLNVDAFSAPMLLDTENLLVKTIAHEFGHCFGLEDDPGPPITVDLRSAMSDPIDPLGEPTVGDTAIIHGLCSDVE